MVDNAMTRDTAPPSKPKRSFFTKPSWAQTEVKTAPVQDSTDFFSRSAESFAQILAEKEKKRKAKLTRKEAETHIKKRKRAEGDVKDRRVSEDTDTETDNETTSVLGEDKKPNGRSADGRKTPEHAPSDLEKVKSNSLSSRYNDLARSTPSPKKKSPRKAPVIVELSDASDSGDDQSHGDASHQDSVAIVARKSPSEDEEDEDIDPELRELAAKARERRRLQEMGLLAGSPSASTSLSAASPASELDPVLKLLITSPVPGSGPLIVSRKMSQTLGAVRQAWCKKQNFSDDFTASVVLTFRNIRVYDSTTCRSLLRDFKEIYEDEDEKMHLVAMTLEFYERERKRHAEELARKNEPQLEEDAKEEPVPVSAKGTGANIKLFLRARGYEEYRLIVRPDTLVSRIMEVFRSQRNVDPDKQLFLVFDGDRLDPNSTVQDAEICDEDNIEVHIK